MLYRADLLRAARAAVTPPMTLDTLAAKVGRTRQTVTRVLSGDPRVGYDTFVAVAEALGFKDMSVLMVKLSSDQTNMESLASVLPKAVNQ